MSEPKSFASLTSSLLARKGGAKPAMRRQGIESLPDAAHDHSDHEDLGWNDMGYDVNPDHSKFDDAEYRPNPLAAAIPDTIPEVLKQQEQIAAKLAQHPYREPVQSESREKATEKMDQQERIPVPLSISREVAPFAENSSIGTASNRRKRSEQPVAQARISRPAVKSRTGKAKAAFTLRLDPERHLKLRLATAMSNVSAQKMVTDALDQYLSKIPELQELAERVPKARRGLTGDLREFICEGINMKRDMILKLAASTMVVAVTLTGCGPFGGGSVASSSSKAVSSKDGPLYAKKAEKAMAKGQTVEAISFAERSVAAIGNNAETRALLGQAYMNVGRFSSAESSFLDAMDLGKNDARTILSLALSQLGQGKANKALQLVEANRQYIPTADYGLALALAGEANSAVDILENAIRSANVTGRTRQNLGLAYALDGRWKEAKLMALQDMSPATVDKRIMQWAQMARPGAYDLRVASVLNVKPDLTDPGQPSRLALNAASSPMANVASADPKDDYSTEVASFDRNTALPAIGPAPRGNSNVDFTAKENNVKVMTVNVPASAPVSSAPMIVAPTTTAKPSKFIVESSSKPKSKPVLSAVKPVIEKAAYAPSSSPTPVASGTHLVQLGAYSTPESAQRAWGIMSARHKELSSFKFATSKATVKGKTFYRLAAMGFGNAQSANSLCAGLKSSGADCIVRTSSSGGVTRMAGKAPTRKLASR